MVMHFIIGVHALQYIISVRAPTLVYRSLIKNSQLINPSLTVPFSSVLIGALSIVESCGKVVKNLRADHTIIVTKVKSLSFYKYEPIG